MEQSELKIFASGESLKPDALSGSDLQKYGKNLKELEELLALEEQYQKASTDLSQTKTKLTRIESEIQREREKEREREQKINDLWEQAKQKEDAGLWEQALDVYLEIVEWNPRHARSITHIQNIKKRLHQRESERTAEEQASRQFRETFEKHLREGELWLSKNEWAKALEEFREAAFMDPAHAEVRTFRSLCENKIREAEEKISREVAENQEKKRQRDECVLEAGEKLRREDFEGSLAAFEKALRFQQDDAGIQEQLKMLETRLREQRSKHEEELKKTENARMEEKQRALQRFAFQAEACMADGEFEKAVFFWDKAIGLEPGSVHAKEGFSKAKLLSRQKEKALRSLHSLESCLEREKKNLRDRENEFQEGLSYFRDGFWEQAEKRFELLRQHMREGEDHGGLGR